MASKMGAAQNNPITDLPPLTATGSRVVNSGIGSNEGGSSCHASDSRPEEIIQKLREADVLLSQVQNVSEACRQIGVTDQTYSRWRNRRITMMLRKEGWRLNHERIERLFQFLADRFDSPAEKCSVAH